MQCIYALYSILCTVLHSVHCITFYALYYILCIVFFTLYSLHCILCILFCALYLKLVDTDRPTIRPTMSCIELLSQLKFNKLILLKSLVNWMNDTLRAWTWTLNILSRHFGKENNNVLIHFLLICLCIFKFMDKTGLFTLGE